jgi:hypothetical protein
MYEDLGDDFFGQNQEGVLLGIEALLCQRFLDPQRGKGTLEIQNLNAIRVKASQQLMAMWLGGKLVAKNLTI